MKWVLEYVSVWLWGLGKDVLCKSLASWETSEIHLDGQGVLKGLKAGRSFSWTISHVHLQPKTILLTEAEWKKTGARDLCFIVLSVLLRHFLLVSCCCCSVAKSRPTLCNFMDCQSLRPPPSPGVCSNSCPLSQWCYLAISSSAFSFSSCPQSFPASGSFPMMSLLFNMLLRFAIAFLPRSKHLLISWLQSLPAVILEPKKQKSATVSIFPLLFAIWWWDWMPWS